MIKKLILASLTTAAVTGSAVVKAQDNNDRGGWSLGAGGVTSLSAYRGVDSQTTAFPFVSYEGQRFFIRGPSVGYRLTPKQPVRLAVFISAAPAEFDPDDSDNQDMRQLDRRNFSALAGISANYDLPAGSLKARLATDITGRHDGQYGEVSYEYPIVFRSIGVILVPSAGVEWHSSNFNDYYFGVSSQEAARTNFSEYEPGASTNPFVGLTVTWQFAPAGSVFVSSRYRNFGDEMADSPMLDDDSEISSLIGVTWKF